MISTVRGAMVTASAVAALVAAPALQAQTTFAGSSNGTFNDGTTSGLSSLGGLTFGAPGTPWSFDLVLGQTLSGISFGSLLLDASVPYNYGGNQSFDIDLLFSAPGGGNQLFIGALSGTITQNATGNVNVAFNGPFTAFLGGGYTVQVSLNNITGQHFGPGVGNNNYLAPVSGSLTFVDGPGTVVTETVPEPITMVLFGTGLAGVAAAKRRRKALVEA